MAYPITTLRWSATQNSSDYIDVTGGYDVTDRVGLSIDAISGNGGSHGYHVASPSTTTGGLALDAGTALRAECLVSNNCSYAMWMYLEPGYTWNTRHLTAYQTTGSGDRRMATGITSGGNVFWNIGRALDSTVNAYSIPQGDVITGAWQHYGLAFSGGGGFCRFYHNGVLVADQVALAATIPFAQYLHFLGTAESLASSNCYLDDIIFSSTVWTDAEFAGLYASDRGATDIAPGGPPPVHPLSGFGHPLGRPGVIS